MTDLSMRDGFANGLVDVADVNPNVVALDADVATLIRFSEFAKKYPERFFEVGVAEQNMASIAAGLATMGFVPFIGTFACFASSRITDQVRVSIAQPRLNVKIAAPYSGLRTGQTGKTHQAIEDISLFRGMPNMTIVAPGDSFEAYQATKAVVDYDGPVYLRLTRDPAPNLFDSSHPFRIGQVYVLREGKHVTIISTGSITQEVVKAVKELDKEGIDCSVVHVPTIKPLDAEAIIQASKRTGIVVTVEEHNILGGLGGAVAEVLSESCPLPVKRIGIQDMFAESGPNGPLMEKYGLTYRHIVETTREWFSQWRKR
jgi:transketolase